MIFFAMESAFLDSLRFTAKKKNNLNQNSSSCHPVIHVCYYEFIISMCTFFFWQINQIAFV